MPRPARPDEFTQINFIVNYFLIGCDPPSAAFFEFAQEPAQDLALFLLAPDLQDLGASLIDPGQGRKRRPPRHGRKRRRFPGLPDTSTMVGQRLNASVGIGQALRLTPLRWIFPLYNIYEGVSFTAAVLEGVTETTFEGILGVVTISNEECNEIDVLRRELTSVVIEGGAGPPIESIPLNNLIRNRGFMNTNRNCRNVDAKYDVAFSAVVEPTAPEEDWFTTLALGTSATDRRYVSDIKETPDKTTYDLSVTGSFEAGENCVWGLGSRKGFYRIISAQLLAWSTADWPWSM